MSRFRYAMLLSALGLLASCRTPGSRPDEMSEAGHQAAAKEAESKAAEHAAKYDPGAVKESWRCDQEGPCWSSLENPTDVHKADARRYSKMAADHRAASGALREAEAKACVGIPERDRDESPFYHREDVLGVEPLRVPLGRSSATRLAGATVAFRPVPGLTQEGLQRIVQCHQARNAVLGYQTPEMAYCPLALKDVTANVRSGGDRFLVEIRSDDDDTASEILTRARRLAPGA